MYYFLLFATPFNPGDLVYVASSVLVSIFFIALYNMYAHATQKPDAIARAKSLLYEIFSGVLIVVIVLSLIYPSSALMNILDKNPDLSIINNQINYLISDYAKTIELGNRLGEVGSYFYTKSFGYIFYFGTMGSPYAGYNSLQSQLSQTASNISMAIFEYKTLVMLYQFFQFIGPSLFLFGFIFRVFPITKKIGALLISLAFFSTILYPYLLYLSQYFYNSLSSSYPLHSQITGGDLESISLHVSPLLKTMCKNNFIRIFTNINEFGWWLFLCPEICIMAGTKNIPICSSQPAGGMPTGNLEMPEGLSINKICYTKAVNVCNNKCHNKCVSDCGGNPGCEAACFASCSAFCTVTPDKPTISSCCSSKWTQWIYSTCLPPVSGKCWNHITYPWYNSVQMAFMTLSSNALLSSAASVSSTPEEVYNIVMNKHVLPVSRGTAFPLMEIIFIGLVGFTAMKDLNALFGGDLYIAGLSRLV